MSKEMTAEEYKEHFDQGLIPFIRESTKTYGDLRAKEALKSIEEKQKRQDEQYAIMAREYEFALNEVIRLQNIVDTGNKEAVKEFAEELIAIIEAHQYDINHPLYKEIDEIKHLAKQKGVEI